MSLLPPELQKKNSGSVRKIYFSHYNCLLFNLWVWGVGSLSNRENITQCLRIKTLLLNFDLLTCSTGKIEKVFKSETFNTIFDIDVRSYIQESFESGSRLIFIRNLCPLVCRNKHIYFSKLADRRNIPSA
jgi:hypothetical protein